MILNVFFALYFQNKLVLAAEQEKKVDSETNPIPTDDSQQEMSLTPEEKATYSQITNDIEAEAKKLMGKIQKAIDEREEHDKKVAKWSKFDYYLNCFKGELHTRKFKNVDDFYPSFEKLLKESREKIKSCFESAGLKIDSIPNDKSTRSMLTKSFFEKIVTILDLSLQNINDIGEKSVKTDLHQLKTELTYFIDQIEKLRKQTQKALADSESRK